MLKSETNTPAIEKKILNAAVHYLHQGDHSLGFKHFQADFEHGQWFVTNLHTGAQWSVNDAEGPGSIDGFSFEMITEGNEE